MFLHNRDFHSIVLCVSSACAQGLYTQHTHVFRTNMFIKFAIAEPSKTTKLFTTKLWSDNCFHRKVFTQLCYCYIHEACIPHFLHKKVLHTVGFLHNATTQCVFLLHDTGFFCIALHMFYFIVQSLHTKQCSTEVPSIIQSQICLRPSTYKHGIPPGIQGMRGTAGKPEAIDGPWPVSQGAGNVELPSNIIGQRRGSPTSTVSISWHLKMLNFIVTSQMTIIDGP